MSDSEHPTYEEVVELVDKRSPCDIPLIEHPTTPTSIFQPATCMNLVVNVQEFATEFVRSRSDIEIVEFIKYLQHEIEMYNSFQARYIASELCRFFLFITMKNQTKDEWNSLQSIITEMLRIRGKREDYDEEDRKKIDSIIGKIDNLIKELASYRGSRDIIEKLEREVRAQSNEVNKKK